MKADLIATFSQRPEGKIATEILRACVHCGFCTATCPTYLTLRDERDSPRGRIYLIKQFLEGGEVSARTRRHLDRCLTCRACETTCPSGVRYTELLEIGSRWLDETLPRRPWDRFLRWALRQTLPWPKRFAALLAMGRITRPLLPHRLAREIPSRSPMPKQPWPKPKHARRMVALAGCVQQAATPDTLMATARVLDALGISLVSVEDGGCCGALSQHLGAEEEAKAMARRRIDAWWPEIEKGAEAVVITASGCALMVKRYGELLADDPAYADKARKVADLAADISEILAREDLTTLSFKKTTQKFAVHVPCTVSHGLKAPDIVDHILSQAGFDLVPVAERGVCCGSAGPYSLLQPALSRRLRRRKLGCLEKENPDGIVTGNVGCQLHLAAESQVPVRHWITLLADTLGD